MRNILFKFAVDSGNLFGSDFYAAKVAGHELKGLKALFSKKSDGLSFPLMALIDYSKNNKKIIKKIKKN